MILFANYKTDAPILGASEIRRELLMGDGIDLGKVI